MNGFKARIEDGFASAARTLYRHPFKALLGAVVFAAFMVSPLDGITIDTSTEGFLHESDPALTAYNDFRDQFGRDEMIVVAVRTPDIFGAEFLGKLRRLHNELRDNVPYTEDITSLVNARNARGEGDRLIVEDLLENRP